MTAYFVTATGTDIGKTHITANLVRALRANGQHASALKPVISGIDAGNLAQSDSARLLEAMDMAVTQQNIARVSPWRFAAPLSPDMAAAREGMLVDFEELTRFCHESIAVHRGTLFIEGVGGVMVPLNERHTVLDWMKALDIPLVLVTGSYLGTLSHTLTAVDVVRRAGLRLAALVVNESADSGVSLEETAESLRRFADGVAITTVARGESRFAAIAAILAR